MTGVRRLIAAWTLAALAVAATPVPEPIDYGLLTHTLAIEALRAGNHDPSGTNEYYFTVVMYGLTNSAEERNLPLPKRKQVPVELGTFGETKIEALSAWHADDKTKDVKGLHILGNAVRELTAQTMTRFHAPESEVAVMVEVTMFAKAKKFGVFGDDLSVAKASYYPIPQSKFDGAPRSDLALTMADDKGTNVKLKVRYDQPATPPAADKPAHPADAAAAPAAPAAAPPAGN